MGGAKNLLFTIRQQVTAQARGPELTPGKEPWASMLTVLEGQEDRLQSARDKGPHAPEEWESGSEESPRLIQVSDSRPCPPFPCSHPFP